MHIVDIHHIHFSINVEFSVEIMDTAGQVGCLFITSSPLDHVLAKAIASYRMSFQS